MSAVYCSHAELDQRAWPETATDCQGAMLIEDQDSTVWTLLCDTCGFLAGIPAHKADPAVSRRLRCEQAGFPKAFMGRFEEDDENRSLLFQLRGWVRDYGEWRALPDGSRPELPKTPAVYGKVGRGKTHILVALCRLLIVECDARVMFRSAAGLLDDLQHSFGDGGELWERATNVEVLALDDLGAEDQTSWRVDRLARLMDERYQHERPLLVATNYPPSLWEERLDERTRSRLEGMSFQVELVGRDRRQQSIEVAA